MIKCPLPWTGISVDPNGLVKNCAVSKQTLGSLENSTIVEILTSPGAIEIRESMRNGVWHTSCGHCQQVESIDVDFSNRAYQLKLHKSLDDSIYEHNQHQLTQLDLRWNNTCNYACIYCSPSLSSQWAQELGKKINIGRQNLSGLKDYVYNNLDNLKEVYLAGGEPLIIKENLEFLDQLYNRNPDVLIRITTNLSNLKTGIYEKIKQFKNVQWEVSVEATEKKFEYIRYPGVWAEFENNLKQLVQEWSNESIGLTMNYFLLNSDSIIDAGEYLINLGMSKNRTAVHYVTFPNFLDARNLNQFARNSAVSYLNSYTDTDTTFGTSLKNCAEFLTKPFDKSGINVVQSLKEIDNRRNLNFELIFPDLIKDIV